MSNAWLVYGRTDYAEPLTARGRIDAQAPSGVAAAAGEAFAADWVELVALPEHEIHWIVRDGAELARERAARAG